MARMNVFVIVAVYFVVCSIFFCVNETAQPNGTVSRPIDRLVYPEELEYRLSLQNHRNQNRPHYHPEDEDYDYGAGEQLVMSNGKMSNSSRNTAKIPLDLIKEINGKDYTINDLLVHYIDDYEDDFIKNRFGDEERASVTMAKQAKCMPELRTVTLVESKDPSVLYIPACTRIERCGGCCMHELLECQPDKIETINIKVIKVMYTGGKTLKYAEKEIVPLDVHKSCKCDCKTKPEDCTPMQVYEKNECRCTCRNTDEAKKCFKENSTKLWNPNACACQCRQEMMCTTGSIFDWRECKCVIKQVRRRNVDTSLRSGYRNNAMSVIPLRNDYL